MILNAISCWCFNLSKHSNTVVVVFNCNPLAATLAFIAMCCLQASNHTKRKAAENKFINAAYMARLIQPNICCLTKGIKVVTSTNA